MLAGEGLKVAFPRSFFLRSDYHRRPRISYPASSSCWKQSNKKLQTNVTALCQQFEAPTNPAVALRKSRVLRPIPCSCHRGCPVHPHWSPCESTSFLCGVRSFVAHALSVPRRDSSRRLGQCDSGPAHRFHTTALWPTPSSIAKEFRSAGP